MGEHIYTQTPAIQNGNDGTDYVMGTLFIPAVTGLINGVRWFAADQGEAGRIGGLYRYDTETSGTLLAQVPFVTVTDGAWNYTPFAAPVAVTAGQRYVTCMYLVRRYTATGGLLNSPIVSGNLTAPADAPGTPQRNGRFLDGTGGMAYPTNGFNGNAYFVDTDFTADVTTQPGRWGVHI